MFLVLGLIRRSNREFGCLVILGRAARGEWLDGSKSWFFTQRFLNCHLLTTEVSATSECAGRNTNQAKNCYEQEAVYHLPQRNVENPPKGPPA